MVLVINEDDSKIVKQIYEYYLVNGYSSTVIAAILSSENAGGIDWKRNRVRSILSNEIYMGDYRNKRILIESHSPAIINRDIFQKVQIQLKGRSKYKRYAYKYQSICYDVLSGEPLRHEPAYNRHGTLYLYYKSKSYNIRISEKIIDEQLGVHVNRWVKNNILADVKSQIKKLCKDDALEMTIMKLNDSGLIGDSYTFKVIRSLKETKRGREEQISQVIKRVRRWEAMINTEQKKFIVNNIKAIYIDVPNRKVKKVEFFRK